MIGEKYFAYGSNMDREQIQQRTGFQGAPAPGKIKGYKLVFNKYSTERQHNVVNIVPTGNNADIVEGVVYTLTTNQLEKLDLDEGANTNNPDYERRRVELDDGTSVYTYVANITNNSDLPPSIDYVLHLLKGKQFFSNSYYQKLLNIPVKEGGAIKDHIQT